jgi:hypothetical protein
MLIKGINPLAFLAFCLFLFVSSEISAQHQGIGLRLGEPLGITYKRYLPANRAVEFVLGTAPNGWSSNYYSNSFEDRYDNYDEVNHDVNSVLYLQGKYLFHNPISAEGIDGKFTWYWGPGILLKSARVEYHYRDELRIDNRVYQKDRTDFDFGPELVGGLEYTFEDAPISVFGELELLLELTDRTTIRLLGGVGARFNF